MEMSNSKLRNTHTQITSGLRQLAKVEGKNPNHVYNRFFLRSPSRRTDDNR